MTTLLTAKTAARIEAAYGEGVMIEVAKAISAHRRGQHAICFRDALREGKRTMEHNSAIRSMQYVCMRADTDALWLIQVGRRGGWRRIAVLTNGKGEAV